MGKLFYAWVVKFGELGAACRWPLGKTVLEMQLFCATFARLKNHAVT
jgi:hypothetical protein